MDTEWMDDAACLDAQPELFFPDPSDHARLRMAVEYCNDCPVIAQCRMYAHRNRLEGVWGGSLRFGRNTRAFAAAADAAEAAAAASAVRVAEARAVKNRAYDEETDRLLAAIRREVA